VRLIAESPPQCVWEVKAELGEGPFWKPQENAVYFVDIFGKSIHRWKQSGERDSWKSPAEPGFLFPCTDGSWICGMRGGLYRFLPEFGTFELLIAVESDQPLHRINDGFVDRFGRLWFGTMHEDTSTRGGVLYSVERGAALRIHDSDYIVTNGPTMSPDGLTLYHSDSARRTVYAFSHSMGRLTNRRTFVTFQDGVNPDGMAVDATGHLWIAVFNGWRIERYTPAGAKVGEIVLPCSQVTKLVFGGADLRTLYITTARHGLSATSQAGQPFAGGLFAARVSVAGLYPTEMISEFSRTR
jgi:D-xylonolactonase